MTSPIRISERILLETVKNITPVYDWRFAEIEKQKPDVGDRIYDLTYGPHFENMAKLPECFFCKIRAIETKVVGEVTLSYSFRLSDIRLAAYNHPSGEHVELSDYGGKVNIKDTYATADIIKEIITWHNRKIDLSMARDQSTDAVRKLLRANKSLAPAIKAYPPLVDLLPPDIRKKIDVPQNRLSSVQMELNPALKQLAVDIALKKVLST
jgi:hypothetical protein